MGETTYKIKNVQKVAYTDSAAASAAVTYTKIRVWAETDCHIAIGDDPTATTSDTPLTAGLPEYFDIEPGQKVSAIRQTSSGDLFVTELAKS